MDGKRVGRERRREQEAGRRWKRRVRGKEGKEGREGMERREKRGEGLCSSKKSLNMPWRKVQSAKN